MKEWIKEAKKMYERGFFDENPESGLRLIAEIELLNERIAELNEENYQLRNYSDRN